MMFSYVNYWPGGCWGARTQRRDVVRVSFLSAVPDGPITDVCDRTPDPRFKEALMAS